MKQQKQELIFVTGKGGVGKSTVAAAIATQRASEGKKTLLVELGYQSFFKDFFDLPQVGYQPQHLSQNLDLAIWSGPEALEEYVKHLLKIEALYRLFFENPVTKALVNVAPALAELSMLGKVTSGIRKVGPALSYDCIVIDSFASGHFLALIRAPKGLATSFRIGPMGEQSRDMDRILRDPEHSKYVVVSLPEDLPVQEALELSEQIRNTIEVEPIQILNRVLAMPAEIQGSGEFVQYLEDVSFRQQSNKKRLEGRKGKVLELPFVTSMNAKVLIDHLAAELNERKL
jgi:anion-transporting  ArsA/GET3 family ATPase